MQVSQHESRPSTLEISQWKDLTPEEKQYQIFHQLVLIELNNVDPGFVNRHINFEPNDPNETIRQEITLFNRVSNLRQSRQLSEAYILLAKAKEMVNLSGSDMAKAFQDFADSLK